LSNHGYFHSSLFSFFFLYLRRLQARTSRATKRATLVVPTWTRRVASHYAVPRRRASRGALRVGTRSPRTEICRGGTGFSSTCSPIRLYIHRMVIAGLAIVFPHSEIFGSTLVCHFTFSIWYLQTLTPRRRRKLLTELLRSIATTRERGSRCRETQRSKTRQRRMIGIQTQALPDKCLVPACDLHSHRIL
jgi:Flp pilus assembly protein TadB